MTALLQLPAWLGSMLAILGTVAVGVLPFIVVRHLLARELPQMSRMTRLERALSGSGVEFTDGNAPGVRLRPKPGEFFKVGELTSEDTG